ncbi:MAG: preprotein translocase subunit SecE [Flavobacteriales bacterium]|jgi:preprotein translocase subunit SecE|nr:preprotein translocase subunit SecE [Flavobacteriales bacterium]
MLEYITASFNELKENVTWPTQQELVSSTVVVAIATLIFALVIYGMDQGVLFVLKTILGFLK